MIDLPAKRVNNHRISLSSLPNSEEILPLWLAIRLHKQYMQIATVNIPIVAVVITITFVWVFLSGDMDIFQYISYADEANNFSQTKDAEFY